jgi:hypothetical protein
VSPVSVVNTNTSIYHFTNTVLLVVLPSTNIFVLWSSSILISLGEILVRAFFTLSDLFNSNETVKLRALKAVKLTYSVLEMTIVDVTVGVCGDTFTAVAI